MLKNTIFTQKSLKKRAKIEYNKNIKIYEIKYFKNNLL